MTQPTRAVPLCECCDQPAPSLLRGKAGALPLCQMCRRSLEFGHTPEAARRISLKNRARAPSNAATPHYQDQRALDDARNARKDGGATGPTGDTYPIDDATVRPSSAPRPSVAAPAHRGLDHATMLEISRAHLAGATVWLLLWDEPDRPVLLRGVADNLGRARCLVVGSGAGALCYTADLVRDYLIHYPKQGGKA